MSDNTGIEPPGNLHGSIAGDRATPAPCAPRSGGRILVDQLLVHGADHAFCVPGESYLPVLDALYDARQSIRLITCRHESAASNMAIYRRLGPGVSPAPWGTGRGSSCRSSVL